MIYAQNFFKQLIFGRTEVKYFSLTDFDQNWYETSVNVIMSDIH